MKRYFIISVSLVFLYVVLGFAVYPLENKSDVIFEMPKNGNIEQVKIHYWDKRSWYKRSFLNKSKTINIVVYKIFYPLVWLRLQTVTLKTIVEEDGGIDFEVQ